MGHFFVMSMRFNKSTAADFGFLSNDLYTAINPNDGSIWTKCTLYDFGWGKENGFYKTPLPSFEYLFDLALYSQDREDMYGAASIIVEKYADELLCQCETLMNDPTQKNEFKKLSKLFQLDMAVNRCSVLKKTYTQIQNDFLRWKNVSIAAMKLK